MKEIVIRLKSKSPLFFKRLTNVGIIMATISGAILAAPVAIPTGIITIAGYALTASTAIATVSKLTIEDKSLLN